MDKNYINRNLLRRKKHVYRQRKDLLLRSVYGLCMAGIPAIQCLYLHGERMNIALTNSNRTFQVSDEDSVWVSKFNWYLKKSSFGWYVCRNVRQGKRIKTIRLHREIMQCPSDKVVDHIDGDTLNNTRGNLEIVTARENSLRRHYAVLDR